MKRLLIAAAAAILTLSGCSQPKAQLDPNLTAAGEIVLRAAIRHGVADYISSHGPSKTFDRAERVKAVLDEVLQVVNGDADVTLANLKAIALAAVSDELTPLEQQDAKDVIDLVGTAIEGYIGQGTLNPAALVKLRDVLTMIAAAAAAIVPPA
jgi:hypothetical protein